MSIKKLLVLPLALLLGACSAEDEPYYGNIVANLKGTDCLADTFSKFGEFLDGKLSNQEVGAFWDCAQVAITSVEQYMVGSAENGNYKSTDVRWFVETYFLKKGKPGAIAINDVLLDELFEIKRVFLGGSRQILTKTEISDTRDLIQEFKEMSLIINPHIKILFFSEKENVGQTEVGRAISDFSQVIQRFGSLIQQRNVPYEFARMVRLVDEVNQIMKDSNKEKPDWLKYVPAIQKTKSILLNSAEVSIGADEWVSLTKIISDALGIYFRGKYFLNMDSLYSLSGVGEFMLMFRSVEGIFSEAFGRRQQTPITNGDIEGLIGALESVDLLPDGFDKEQIMRLWTVLVDQILAPSEAHVIGFAPGELGVLNREFEGFYRSQRFLLGEQQSENDEYVQELVGVLNTPWPYFTDDKGRLIFSDPVEGEQKINIESSSQMNWIRAAIRLVIIGYAEDPESKTNLVGLTKAELKVAFADIKPLLVAMDLISEDNVNFADKLFVYGSLFVPRGNGDEMLDFYEIIDWVHFVFAGIDMGKNLVASLPATCTIDEDLIDHSCYRENLKILFEDKYSNIPRMVAYLKGLSPKDLNRAFDGLEKAVRDEGLSDLPIKRADTYEIGIMMMFIETIMTRFDLDRSGFMETKEGLNAVPLFQDQLMKVIKINDKKEIRRIFTFMLKYGEPPNTKNPISLLRYLHWRWTEKSWKFSADRGKLISILANLGENI